MRAAKGKKIILLLMFMLYIAYALILLLLGSWGSSFWVALAFGLMQLAVLVIGLSKATYDVEGIFLLYPKLLLPTVCYFAQLLAGAIIVIATPMAFIPLLLIGIVLLAVSITTLLGVGQGVEYAMDVESRIDESTSFMRDFVLRTQNLSYRNSYDPQTTQTLKQIIENARYSDARSTSETKDIEEEMEGYLASLEAKDDDSGVVAQMLLIALDERARVLKAGKTA